MMCKVTARHPLRRRKNYAYFLSVVLLCALAWLRLAEFDAGYTPLRPLMDAESEARRLLAFIIHYNYQCNTTAGQIGNWTMWPVCVGREAGLNFDSKDSKLMYTIGYVIVDNSSFIRWYLLKILQWINCCAVGLRSVNLARIVGKS